MFESLIRLDEEQREIVESGLSGSLIIRSASGTGKTRVLMERIIALIGRGVSPDSIFGLLLTPDEEEHIKRIIGLRLGNYAYVPKNIGTFCSVFTRILRNHIDKVDQHRTKDFEIIGIEKQNKKLRSLARSLKTGALLDDECYEVRKLFVELRTTGKVSRGTMHLNPEQLKMVWEQYQNFIHSNNQLDADEVMIMSHRLLTENPEIRESLTQQFKYIFVDEIQDLNMHKWNLLKLMVKKNHTVFLGAGDPNGAVFMHDGSLEDIYDRVQDELPETRICTLYKNWRSTRGIVNLANDLRPLKYGEVVAMDSEEMGIELYNSDKTSIEQIVESTEYSKWVILYRFSKWLPRIQQALEDRGIPYNMKNADQDQNQYRQENSVALMSIHDAKGLEWDNVMIWKYRTIRELLVDTEDRNLTYVAVSRARKRLLLCKYRERKMTELGQRKYL